jgi:hypothetical protein
MWNLIQLVLYVVIFKAYWESVHKPVGMITVENFLTNPITMFSRKSFFLTFCYDFYMSVFCCNQRLIQFEHPLWGSVSPFGWTLCGTMLSSSSLQEFFNQHFRTSLQSNVCKGMGFWAIFSLNFCYLYVSLPLLYSVYWWKPVCFTHKTLNTGAGHLFMKQVVSICRLWKLQSELRCKE